MKRYTLYTFPALALLLAATACTQDDAGTLPDGTQPLTPRHRGQPVERQ